MSIPDYVEAKTKGEDCEGTLPTEIAAELLTNADRALELARGMAPGNDRDLRYTLGDIRTVAHLGRYYGHKIQAATDLALYRATQKSVYRTRSVIAANQAAEAWRRYVSLALTQYENPLWMNRVGYADWRALFRYVLEDIEIAGGQPELRSMEPTPGGDVYEAEEARQSGGQVNTRGKDYTGKGYLEFSDSGEPTWVEWNCPTTEAGRYLLEIRYTGIEQQQAVGLIVNGEPVSNLVLWGSGGSDVWAWDRKSVILRSGTNTIRLEPAKGARIDHLNRVPVSVAY